MRALLFLSITIALSACSTVSTWFEGVTAGSVDENAVGDAPVRDKNKPLPVAIKPSSNEELELRIARLSSRIDELESQIVQQRERSKLVEKGLVLGLIPDELKSEGLAVETKPKADKPVNSLSAVKLLEVKTPEPAKGEGSQDRELYRKMLQEAQEKFNRANYGQAITAYSEIGAKFDDGVTEGSQLYWIGLSWYYLKEYKLAEENFSSLRSRYPASPWSYHAQFYLAKVDLSRGFQQRALDQFQKILDENPSRDIGEMAQSEIERMKEKL